MKTDLDKILLLLGCILSSAMASFDLAADVTELNAVVIYDDAVSANINKYGVNGPLLWSRVRYGDAGLVDINNQLGLKFGRFPGGTIGNFYDWKAGSFSCNRPPNRNFVKRIGNWNESLKKNNRSYKVDDFIKFIAATRSEFTYMLNIMCQSPTDNLELLKDLRDNDIVLNYVEMGNELHSKSYAWGMPSAKNYLQSSAENYKSVKSVFPEAKVGLLVSPISFDGKSVPRDDHTANPNWPQRMKEFDSISAGSNVADALIIHMYSYPYHRSRLSSFISTKMGDEELYKNSIDQLNKKFQASINYLKKLGNGKPIWITEWGATAPIDQRGKDFKRYLKGPYQALYLASGLMLISLEEEVEIANYHNFSDLWNKKNGVVEISEVGKVMQLFTEAADKAERVYPLAMSSIGGESSGKGIKAALFDSAETDFLLMVNEQDKPYTLKSINFQGRGYINYRSSSLYIDGTKFEADKYTKRMTNSGKDFEMEIKPFSVTQVLLEQ